MTDDLLDESQIGPLSQDLIPAEPVNWGSTRSFAPADESTLNLVESWIERYHQRAEVALADEMRAMATAINRRAEPTSALHGVIYWGPMTMEALAGYLGHPVSLVRPQVEMLTYLGVVIPVSTEDDSLLEFNDRWFPSSTSSRST